MSHDGSTAATDCLGSIGCNMHYYSFTFGIDRSRRFATNTNDFNTFCKAFDFIKILAIGDLWLLRGCFAQPLNYYTYRCYLHRGDDRSWAAIFGC